MDHERYYELPEFAGILAFIDAIFAELNMGLLIYHVEDPQRIGEARLIYANRQASECTGTDLRRLLGKPMLEAFPHLAGTNVPKLCAEVAELKEPRKVGVVEYEDDNVRRGRYETRAFPMPHQCVGVLFESVGSGS